MHRISATPTGWTPDTEGVIIVEQTPADIIILTAADTDIQTLASALDYLPEDFPSIRALNLLQLQQQFSIDDYADKVLSSAKTIVLRLLGGRSYWSYGLEVVKEIVSRTGAKLWVLPGDEKLDPILMSQSTVSLAPINQLWRYLTEGGVDNWLNALKLIANTSLNYGYDLKPPRVVPKIGIFDREIKPKNFIGKAAIFFYRSHYLAGNTRAIQSLCQALEDHNIEPLPLFVSSLKEPDIQESLREDFLNGAVDLILNTTSFAIASGHQDNKSNFWQTLNLPVFQVILSGGTEEGWQEGYQGLSPRDVAMNIALPEVDGRIITRAVSFKSVQVWEPRLETSLVVYQPREDRVRFVADLATNWIKLRHTPDQNKKIVIVLANYPNKDGRLANGVGLDTPASCIEILKALREAGYGVTNIPADGDELIKRLTTGVTNDIDNNVLRHIYQSLPLAEYLSYFESLPNLIQEAVTKRWGKPTEDIAISGIGLGNVFIGIQPSRGYDIDPSLNYHAPDLEPTHAYLAYYYWLRQVFEATAVIHLGKHGNLEWLPGKSIALSPNCYPEIALQTLPNFYPFIVNDPGEGSQAKRRSHAVIIDHLTPPLTRAGLYGDLSALEASIDEYYEALSLDPGRLKIIAKSIRELIDRTGIDRDLGIDGGDFNLFLARADGYLCELKEAQIRDGLHIFGVAPKGELLRDLILSIARSPGLERLGLTRAIARDLGLDFDPLAFGGVGSGESGVGDMVTYLEDYALEIISGLKPTCGPLTRHEWDWIEAVLIPALHATSNEIEFLLRGLAGAYVPPGPSGAPTRGRPEVLPTGRNFYSVDISAIPTPTAWEVGSKAADALIERYTQENGEYPRTLAISIWGTSTMRTGGDDVAQVLSLLGIRPVWDSFSRRVVDLEILSPSALGRPRVDVTVRVSGFFRDGFPNLLHLLNFAINTVASQEEEEEINPLAAQVKAEQEFWINQGCLEEEAKQKATYRIFGSKPGAYGAGLQGLIESQNWEKDEDLARAYINWSCYAYDGKGKGNSVKEVFQQRLEKLQVIVQNQDNREHDILDSDDYYQFQGGLTASVRALTGKNPRVYHGDNSNTEYPRVRSLKEEILRVYRSRVVNPKWIQGVMRHGYKGVFEMAATVDYLFAYDATTRCVEDFMYEGVAEAYLFEPAVQKFIEEKNPWAMRDMGERLLEAHQRGLWQGAKPETIEGLRCLVHQAEGAIESR